MIVGYARVSTRDQTPENQFAELNKRGLMLAEEYETEYKLFEETESTRKTRPVKESIIALVRRGEVQAVVVWKLDRFARSVYELNQNLTEIKKHKVRFISLRDGLDLGADSGAVQELYFNILGAFSQFERDIIQERIYAGMARKKAEGFVWGRPKGSKDKKVRRKSGYHLRWAK